MQRLAVLGLEIADFVEPAFNAVGIGRHHAAEENDLHHARLEVSGGPPVSYLGNAAIGIGSMVIFPMPRRVEERGHGMVEPVLADLRSGEAADRLEC